MKGEKKCLSPIDSSRAGCERGTALVRRISALERARWVWTEKKRNLGKEGNGTGQDTKKIKK